MAGRVVGRLTLALLAGLVSASCGGVVAPGVALTGHWGGKDFVLDLTASGGTFDSGCSTGELSAPLVPDVSGAVSAPGFSITIGGAPPPPGYVPERVPIVASGRVDGVLLRLSVRATGVAYVNGPPQYLLARGVTGEVFRCP